MPIWSKGMTSVVEEKPRLITAGSGVNESSLHLLRFLIGFKTMCHFFIPIRGKTKASCDLAACIHFPVGKQLHVIMQSFDWLVVMVMAVVIG